MEPLPRVTSRPPLSTKRLQFREAGPADAAGDVVGLGGRAEAGSLRRFLEGHWAPAFGQALNLFGEFEIDVAVKKHIDFVSQSAGANVFVANIGVGNFALVEEVADPADGVGVGPGNPNADARNFRSVMRNVRDGVEALVKSRPSSVATERRASGQAVLRGENPGAGGEVDAAHFECVLGDFDIELAASR